MTTIEKSLNIKIINNSQPAKSLAGVLRWCILKTLKMRLFLRLAMIFICFLVADHSGTFAHGGGPADGPSLQGLRSRPTPSHAVPHLITNHVRVFFPDS